MSTSRIQLVLGALVAIPALIVTSAGLFWHAGPGPFSFTTLHGRVVEIYGQGLYRYDTAFRAPILRGTDAMMLCVGVPMLLLALVLSRRGSLRAGFLLAGMQACFLYHSASVTLGAAYNPLFVLYLVYFSASLYAFVLACTAIDLPGLPEHIAPGLPHRGIGAFMFLAGLSPLIWFIPIIGALLKSQWAPAELASYTTDVTAALDLGIITPACCLSGVLLFRRAPLGYLLATVLLILLALTGLVVVGQTMMQLLDGVVLSASDIATFVVPFVVLSLVAIGLDVVIFRHLRERRPVAVRDTPVAP